MLNNDLVQQIKRFLPYHPTKEQDFALNSFVNFWSPLSSKEEIFLLKGYAGTGKTTLISSFIKSLKELNQKCILLAPTGRAAKVLSLYADHSAYTIHRKIYRQRSFSNETDNFVLNKNLHSHTLFIVDEASMIANDGLSGRLFGGGYLLDDLIHYVYSGLGCKLMLVGDTAQLPPIGENESPALSTSKLESYGLNVYEHTLTQVVRQKSKSGILYNATILRQFITQTKTSTLPKIHVKGFPDVQIISGNELIDTISTCYDKAGIDETMIICRSNKQATLYNKGIRNSILYREEELNTGDLLMVAKNNYYWSESCKDIDFIANGDIAIVRRVRRTHEMYNFRFADVILSFPDYENLELEVKILLDTLHIETPSLTKEQNDGLFYAVLEDYADISTKRDKIKKIKEDCWYNALQVKYAYAVTCHKAQGGQWQRVFIDQGYITKEMLTPDYFRWLYTAFTRATETVYLVNWPKEQVCI